MESERTRPGSRAAEPPAASGGGGGGGHEAGAGAIHGYGAAAAVRAASHTNAAAAATNNSCGSSNMIINSGYTSSSSSSAAAVAAAAAGAFLFPNAGTATATATATATMMKKKRGRPRKYGPDGTPPRLLSLSVAAPAAVAAINNNNNNNSNNSNNNNNSNNSNNNNNNTTSSSPGQHAAVIVPYPFSPIHPEKRGRGRPPGSGKNQQLAALGELMLGSIGVGFTPHAITIAAGEDITSRIMSFSQQGPRGVCILSANGAISNVTLRQTSISGGAVTYEGRFEILSVSGSFLVTESGDGTRSRTGGLSVSLAGPDGRVIGGSVAGALIAATPVQMVVGSFLNTFKKLQQPKSASKPQASLTGLISTSQPTTATMHSDLARAFHVNADKSMHAAAAAEAAAAAGGGGASHAATDGAISSNSDSSKEYNVVD